MNVKNIENDLREYYNAIGRCDHHKMHDIELSYQLQGFHHLRVCEFLADRIESETGQPVDLDKVLS